MLESLPTKNFTRHLRIYLHNLVRPENGENHITELTPCKIFKSQISKKQKAVKTLGKLQLMFSLCKI